MRKKNPAAVALGRRRARQFTPETQAAAALAKAATMTPEEREELGRKAGIASGKARKKKKLSR